MILIGVGGLAGCDGSGGGDGVSAVTGEASFRERVSLPAGTRLEVTLSDVTAEPPTGQLVTRIVVARVGQPPYAFEVPFRRADLVEDHRYVVTARLMDREDLLFETPAPTPVITQGHPTDVQLRLRRPGAEPPDARDAPGPLADLPATFTGTLPCADCPGIDYHVDFFGDETFHMRIDYRDRDSGPFDAVGRWARLPDRGVVVLRGAREGPVRLEAAGGGALRLLERDAEPIESGLDYALERAEAFDPITPELRMRGMYRYLADAGLYTECRTGRPMPVAQDGANAALERGYLEARSEPGAPMLAEVTGRIARRPPMDGGEPVPTVVPVAFHAVWPRETCGRPFTDAELVGTYWKLVRLAETAVRPVAEAREPHLVLDAGGGLAGSDGCNRLMGSYEIDGRRLALSNLASTKMACPHSAESAEQFRAALARTATYRVAGSHLQLYNDSGHLLARFEAVYGD